jgi:hypothetical protein
MNVTAGHGPVSFNLPAGIASDLAGNASLAATELAVAVDLSAPLPTLTTATPSLSNAASFMVAANFGERVLGFELGDLLLINGIASNLIEVNQSTGSYTFVVTPVAAGVASVLVPAGSAADQAGNLTLASILLSRTFDRVAPAPVLTTTEPSRTNKTTFEVVVNFGEAVVGLTKNDFQVTGATISDPQDLGSGRYAVTLSNANGLVELQIGAGAVQDAAGNNSIASSKLSVTVDTAALVPVVSSTSTGLLNTGDFDVTVIFGKEVIGFTANKATALGGTISNFIEADRATGRYTFNVQATADGAVTVLVPAGVVTDLAGNLNSASNSMMRTIDRVKPEPTLTVPFVSITNQSTFDVTVDFGEAVTGFELTDLVVGGATLSNLRLVSGGRYLVTASATNGTFSVGLPAAAASDLAGNSSDVATTLTRTVDLQGVNVTLSSTQANLSNASSFAVAIDFAESVLGFTLSDLTVLNGTASNLVATDASTGKYTVTITPIVDGSVTVLLPANSVTDFAGNGNLAAAAIVRTIDRVAPVAILSTTEPSRTNKATFEVIADFGKAVTGLTRSDLVVTGGTASEPRLLGSGRYAFTISATSTDVLIRMMAGAVIDGAGNTSLASNAIELGVDTTRTMPVMATTVPNLTNAGSFVVSIDFFKPVFGFSDSNLIVLGGSLSEFTTVDESTGKYSVRVTPISDGVVTLLLPANAAADLAGNGNLAATALVRTIDRIAPVITLTTSQSSPTNQTTFDVIVQTSKAISGLTASAFSVSGGSIGQPAAIANGRYIVTVTAAGGLFELFMPSGAVFDAAGNGNAATATLSIEVTPRSLVLVPQAINETIDLAAIVDADLIDLHTIDLRGLGDNELRLDSGKIAALFANSTATVFADRGDQIVFDGPWEFGGVTLVDGAIHRQFTKSGATVSVNGPLDFSNPLNRFDVDTSGRVEALDALLVLTTMRMRQLAEQGGSFLPFSQQTIEHYRFVDVSQDNQLTPLDALLVLNEISRINRERPSAEGEQNDLSPQVFGNPTHGTDRVPSTRDDDMSISLERIPQAKPMIYKNSAPSSIGLIVEVEAIKDSTPSDTDESPFDKIALVDEAFADPLLLS